MPKSAEQRVLSRLGEALPPPYELFANVRWISKPERNSPARDGETDLVIMNPRHGLLIVETKGGRIRRDGQGRWWTNEQPLKVPPFKQAENSRHALRRKIALLPEWSRPLEQLRIGHAVAFPNATMAKIASRERGLGPDAPLALVIDQADLETPETARKAIERAYDYWLGDRRRGTPLTAPEMNLIAELLSPTVELRPLLRLEVEEGEREVVRLTEAQLHVLDMLRGQRRAEIVGPAGCGKTMLARQKARRLAKEGFSTLLVCFNQPLARTLRADLADGRPPAAWTSQPSTSSA